jgi:dTDP-4-amino-4,6-dideoxygalactose transaminase
MALAAAGVGPGDEVITSAFSFVATAMAILHQNAIPVFVDIDPKTWCISPELIEAAVTGRTRAILPVHIHGAACNMDKVLEIAKRHDLVVIEDAAQAPGSEYRGRKVGTLGALGCFSLQSSKNFACGEGGLLVTDSDALIERAARTRGFGEDFRLADEADYRIERALDGNRAYDSVTIGWMYRMTELSASVASAQLERLDHYNENARRNAAFLSMRLSRLSGVSPQLLLDGTTSGYHKYRVRLDPAACGVDAPARLVRDAMTAALKAEGLDVVLWQTVPVPGQRVFREKVGYGKGCPWDHGAPISYDLSQYPQTVRLLDNSLVLFSQTYPIAPQSLALCEAYAEAFERVWKNLPEVITWYSKNNSEKQ